jgi:hypothetical protein
MVHKLRLLTVAVALVAAPILRAQTPASTSSTADLVYVVAFVDVDPRQAALCKQHSDGLITFLVGTKLKNNFVPRFD